MQNAMSATSEVMTTVLAVRPDRRRRALLIRGLIRGDAGLDEDRRRGLNAENEARVVRQETGGPGPAL
ncbi:hypothetical protein GCM10023089_12050 [Quisquiliibacterium transsilvanicum]